MTHTISFSRRLCARALQTILKMPPQKSRGERSAERRVLRDRTCGCGAPSVSSQSPKKDTEGARLPALHRGACGANECTAQPRPCFLGRATRGVTRDTLSQSSDAPRGPVVMPAEAMPGPPGAGLQAPPAGTAPPIARLSPVDDPRWARWALRNCNETIVKGIVTVRTKYCRPSLAAFSGQKSRMMHPAGSAGLEQGSRASSALASGRAATAVPR